MSMAELAISLMIFSMLIVSTLAVTSQVQRLYARDTASDDVTQAAKNAMDVLVRDLHGVTHNTVSGTSLGYSETTGSAVTFYVSGTTGPVRERVSVDAAGVLWKETTLPDTASVAPAYTYATNLGQRTVRLAARTATATGATPLFSYLVNGSVSTSVTLDSDRASIAAVVVTLTISAPVGTGGAAVTLVNTAGPLIA